MTLSSKLPSPGVKTLVALILLLLLAGPAYSLLAEWVDRWHTTRKEGKRLCLDQMKEMEKAIEIYRLDCGEFPESLEILTRPMKDEPDAYLYEVPLDAWKERYVYRPGRSTGGGDFQLFSKGPDRRPDTEDDVSLDDMRR